jgi:Uma2 family endonuclease
MHGTMTAVMRTAGVSIRYPVRRNPEAWVLPDGPVPQSIPHDDAAEHLRRVLTNWAARSGRNVKIARDLAVRWLEEFPRTGIDPDVCVLEPPPPDFEHLESLRLWRPGHAAPPLCFEVVSTNHPHKDYRDVQDRYADLGTLELVVFDPLLVGYSAGGGPVLLQIWRRDATGLLDRVHFSNEPGFCEVLGAWLMPSRTLLQIAEDRAGTRRWLTAEELERAEKEHERAEKERERAEKEHERAEKERERAAREALERRVADLEARAARES